MLSLYLSTHSLQAFPVHAVCFFFRISEEAQIIDDYRYYLIALPSRLALVFQWSNNKKTAKTTTTTHTKTRWKQKKKNYLSLTACVNLVQKKELCHRPTYMFNFFSFTVNSMSFFFNIDASSTGINTQSIICKFLF